MRLRIAIAFILGLGCTAWSCAQEWERLGPEGGTVVSLGKGAGNEVFLGTADGHVFASTDGARSWELRGRVGSRLDAVITSLVADPRIGGRAYAAVWYQEAGAGGGVFASEDGGRSWVGLGLGSEAVRALEIAPSQPDVLIAGTRSGVFRSANQGREWERISPEGDEELRNVDSIAIDPRSPDVIYAGTYHLPWRTLDGGKNWQPVVAGIIDDSDIMSIRLDATNPDRVYMSACSGIYRSENRGDEWIKLQGIPYAARRTQAIVQDNSNSKTLYAGTTEGLWITRDGGESWARTTTKEWVVNSVVVLEGGNGGSGRVVLGTEGQGVQVSDDAGMSFAAANHGFAHVLVKQLLAARKNSAQLLMVVEQNGLQILESDDSGKSWAPVSLATTRPVAKSTLSVDSIQRVYASPWGWLLQAQKCQLWIQDERRKEWHEWKLRKSPERRTSRAAGVAKKTIHEAMVPLTTAAALAFSDDAAFVSTPGELARCAESGICERTKAFGRLGEIRAVSITPGGWSLAVISNGRLGISEDGGGTASWRDLPVSNDEALWVDVVDSSPSRTVYLGTSRGLFSTSDAGEHWHRVEGGLPGGWIEQWLRQPEFWALTERDGGMYISQDQGGTWRRADQDEERGRFTGLAGLGNGDALVGSQREGLLRLKVAAEAGKY